jgi:hypothetical protein
MRQLTDCRLQDRRHLGTHKYLPRTASPSTKVNKVLEGRPHIVDSMKNGGSSW